MEVSRLPAHVVPLVKLAVVRTPSLFFKSFPAKCPRSALLWRIGSIPLLAHIGPVRAHSLNCDLALKGLGPIAVFSVGRSDLLKLVDHLDDVA